MIITKSWLSDWLDSGDKSLNDIAHTLNSIGIEVDKICTLKVPDEIVVGFIREEVEHENSSKLGICQVGVGNKILQVVCGAQNVAQGQFIAVALKSALMPNGMEIREAKLRGIDSYGMLCFSTGLGFEKVNDGIILLDDGIGKLELGKALNSYEIFNDGLIEVELTPNRGDCLSVYGIAHNLAVASNLNLKEKPPFKEGESVLGIGRILRLSAEKELNSLYNYRTIELKEKIQANLLISLRLAQIENFGKNPIENLLNYATHSTGILFNVYDLNSFYEEDEEFTFSLVRETRGEIKISYQDKLLSVSEIYREEKFKCKEDSKIIIIEANCTDPAIIADAKMVYKEQDEQTICKSLRGSESKLNLNVNFLLSVLEKNPNLVIYSSSQQVITNRELSNMAISIESINRTIGQETDKDEVLKILKGLGFELIISADGFVNVEVPMHRPDIENLADICGGVVRVIGIDNITSKGLEFVEKNRLNSTYKNYKELAELRKKTVANEYFESLYYVLDNEEELRSLGFNPIKLGLINPITAELNTLGATLLNHLLNAASLNAKNSKKVVKLFELRVVFGASNEELNHIAFVHSDYQGEPEISNKAKPELVDFYDFLLDLKNIIRDFKLKASKHDISGPYEQADIYLKDLKISFAGRLHLKIENERDLLKTYICELDLNLTKHHFRLTKPYSKFPNTSRDLSILIPKGFEYEKIRNCIEELDLENLENFRLVDLYSDVDLEDSYSLAPKFVFRDVNKTLEEAQVTEHMDKILQSFKEVGLELR